MKISLIGKCLGLVPGNFGLGVGLRPWAWKNQYEAVKVIVDSFLIDNSTDKKRKRNGRLLEKENLAKVKGSACIEE